MFNEPVNILTMGIPSSAWTTEKKFHGILATSFYIKNWNIKFEKRIITLVKKTFYEIVQTLLSWLIEFQTDLNKRRKKTFFEFQPKI